MATILLIIIYVAFISLGLPDSLLGAAWPVAYLELGAPVSYGGIVSVFVTAGTVVSSLLSVRVIRRFGTGGVTAACVAITAGALLGVSLSHQFYWILLFAIPLGLGAGSIDAALNNYVALHYKASHMSFLHSFWGVGATISPLIMAYFLRQNGNWRGGYFTVSMIQFVLAAVLLLSLPLWRRVPNAVATEETDAHALIGNRVAIRRKGAVLAVLSFFFYCAAETTTGLWAPTYFVSVRAVEPSIAAFWGSMFFFGIMGGRMLSGLLAMKLSEKTMLTAGIAVAAAGAALLALPLSGYAPLVGLLLFGVGCAPVFPNLIHITPRRFGAAYSQAVIGLQMAAAYVGSTLMPPLIGWIGQKAGFGLLPYYLLGCLLALGVSIWFCNRRTGFGVQETAGQSAAE